VSLVSVIADGSQAGAPSVLLHRVSPMLWTNLTAPRIMDLKAGGAGRGQ
jgi:hypothetical protein